jgi:hypothetical protein
MLDLLIHDPELRRDAAARQRKRIEGEYLWPTIARTIERTYFNVLGWGGSEHVANDRQTGELIQIRTFADGFAPLDRVSVP